jgi:hypothetical protein
MTNPTTAQLIANFFGNDGVGFDAEQVEYVCEREAYDSDFESFQHQTWTFKDGSRIQLHGSQLNVLPKLELPRIR